MIGLFFEELELGRRIELGTYRFTEENIRRFSTAFVPVPFHMSAEAAAAGLLGGTAAAGLHTCCGWMTCYVATNTRQRQRLQSEVHALPEIGPSPGISNIQWLKPVHAGDVIAYASTIIAKRELASRPGWGVVTSLNEGVNALGVLVMSFESAVFVARKLTS